MLRERIARHVRRIAAHLMRRTITEIEVIPEHDERSASPEYLRNREQLIEKDGLRCWVCESVEDREAHHWLEWAEADNIDWTKAAEILAALDFHGYGRRALTDPITNPDHIANLCVLCRQCHRERGFGIHNTTGPVWWARKTRKKGVHVVQEVT